MGQNGPARSFKWVYSDRIRRDTLKQKEKEKVGSREGTMCVAWNERIHCTGATTYLQKTNRSVGTTGTWHKRWKGRLSQSIERRDRISCERSSIRGRSEEEKRRGRRLERMRRETNKGKRRRRKRGKRDRRKELRGRREREAD